MSYTHAQESTTCMRQYPTGSIVEKINRTNKMETTPPTSIFLAMTRVKPSSSLLNPIKPQIDPPWHCSFSLTEACMKF